MLWCCRPSDCRLRPLGPRDLLSEGRQVYEIILTYNFHVGKACEVQPLVPMFSRFLYESDYENQLWMIFSSNKQLVGCGEAFPWRVSLATMLIHHELFAHLYFSNVSVCN